jgi:protein disulfide-isomerase A6
MHHHGIFAAGILALAAAPGVLAESMYPKSSAVLNVDGKSYDRLIAQSNYTSIVEFYAPWCGHCKNLKPAYEKAAKSLDGLAKVAAVNCDDDANKPLCGKFGIQGFPTLKIVRPGKKAGRPVVEDYQGARTASGIVEAVQGKINNHVKKVTDADISTFLADADVPKALLFTDKGTTSSLAKSIAIDFLDVVTVGQVRNNQKEVVEKYGVEDFPSLVLLPAGGADPIVYDGAFKKAALVEFISQLGAPNPDPAPAAGKKEKKDSKPKAEKKDTKPKADKKAEKKAEKPPVAKEEPAPEAAAEDAPEEAAPTEEPMIVESLPVVPSVGAEILDEVCFAPKAHTCVLALVPAADSDDKKAALAAVSEIATKHINGGRRLFPFYEVRDDNTKAAPIRESLGLSAGVELVAVNARRNWSRRFQGTLDAAGIESWIDAIRMGEGDKTKLPQQLIAEPKAKSEDAPKAESSSSAAGTIADAPEPATDAPADESTAVPVEDDAAETPIKHEEL